MLRVLVLFAWGWSPAPTHPIHSSLVQIIMEKNHMEKQIATLKQHEGIRNLAYRDSLGVLTIGCDINISDNEDHR